MPLRDVLIVILAITSMVFVPVAAMQRAPNGRFRKGIAPFLTASTVILLLVIFLSGRSLGFGVDTATYAELFAGYCRGHSMNDEQFSYVMTVWLLNAGMFGACNVAWMPSVWGLLVIAPLLAMREPLPLRLCFAAVLMFSLVGIELTTNALRQGLSVSACMLAISVGRRHWALGLPVAILSLLLHTSTVLVFAVLAFALLPWRLFFLAFVGSIALVMQALQSGLESALLQPLLYEVQKYLAHEADEFWVRVLGFACVLAALVCPWLIRRSKYAALLKNKNYQIAMRLGVACLPFLALPYFGYRMLYGIYPLVLFFTFLSGRQTATPLGRHFALLFTFNAVVLLVWAQGSAAMRDVAFFN